MIAGLTLHSLRLPDSMQLLTFLTMDKPESLEEDHIRDEKV
jgi:hypothetical protein